MISVARELLVELGLSGGTDRPRINVAFTRGASVTAEAHLGAAGFVHFKASELESLEREYRATLAARERFGAVVPEPLAFVQREGWEVIASRGVRFATLAPSHFARGAVPRALEEFLVRGVTRARAVGLPSPLTQLETLAAHPLTARWARVMLPHLDERVRTFLTNLAPIPQHCDLTCNNIGVTHDGAVVVFDWEEFGAASVPGLDLCTLLVSLADFDARVLRAWLACAQRSQSGPAAFAATACRALGIDPAVFEQLLPLYVLLFLRLKAGYSERLRESLARLLQDLLSDTRAD